MAHTICSIDSRPFHHHQCPTQDIIFCFQRHPFPCYQVRPRFYLHATLFNPVLSTLVLAIKKNHFTAWPGLTTDLILRHLPPSIATSRGHLRGQQQNIRSTKLNVPPLPLATSLDIAPSQVPGNLRTHDSFTQLIDMKCFARSYSDQTGRFPVQSSRGNKCIFIMYDFDSNAILSVALPDRRGSSIQKAWLQIFNQLTVNGYRPKLHILDNECFGDLKHSFTKNQVDFQRVPAHLHRRNAAERAIQTWKHHFIAGVTSTDPSFPLNAWDYLLPQCDITLNHLRSSRRQPTLSLLQSICASHTNYSR